MKDRFEQGYLFSEGGIHCPLCGGRMTRGALFCGHCRRNGRFHIEANKIRMATKGIYLPRVVNRHHLRHTHPGANSA